ncbi:UNVERIFIED_CONTAM: hypothetical protein K2H54_046746 [Gekko kuhli]
MDGTRGIDPVRKSPRTLDSADVDQKLVWLERDILTTTPLWLSRARGCGRNTGLTYMVCWDSVVLTCGLDFKSSHEKRGT